MNREGRNSLLLLGLAVPVILFRLGGYSLVNGDEGFYHAVARTMVASGDWTRIVFTGEHRVYDTFLNAPIQYWARAVLISVIGDSYWSVRLLSALCAVAGLLLTCRLATRLAGPAAGLLAGLVQLTTFQFVYLHCARTGELEPMVCLVYTASALSFLRAVQDGRSFVPHHLCLMLLMNLKAPFVMVGLIADLGMFALWPEARGHLRRWLLSAAILPLGGAWHLFQLARLGSDGIDAFAIMAGEASGATWEGPAAMSNVAYYVWVLMFGAFPYTFAYALAVPWLLIAPRVPRERAATLLLAIHVAAVFAFYLPLAKRFYWYVTPIYPFLSAILGIWFMQLRSERRAAGVAAVGAFSVALLMWIWVKVDWNPFAESAAALTWRPELAREMLGMRRIAGVSAWIGVPITTTVAAAFLVSLVQRAGARGTQIAAALVAACYLGAATVRVVVPLKYTKHRTPTALLHADIERGLKDGQEPLFPVAIADPDLLRVRFYFGDRFEIEPEEPGDPARSTNQVFYLLTRPKDGPQPRCVESAG